MVRKEIMHEPFQFHIRYIMKEFELLISKNDLPIRTIITIDDSEYLSLCKWYLIKQYKNNHFENVISRNNELPCYINFYVCYINFYVLGYEQKFCMYDIMYRYNGYSKYLVGHDKLKLGIPNKSYKFIQGICLKQLKEEVIND